MHRLLEGVAREWRLSDSVCVSAVPRGTRVRREPLLPVLTGCACGVARARTN